MNEKQRRKRKRSSDYNKVMTHSHKKSKKNNKKYPNPFRLSEENPYLNSPTAKFCTKDSDDFSDYKDTDEAQINENPDLIVKMSVLDTS